MELDKVRDISIQIPRDAINLTKTKADDLPEGQGLEYIGINFNPDAEQPSIGILVMKQSSKLRAKDVRLVHLKISVVRVPTLEALHTPGVALTVITKDESRIEMDGKIEGSDYSGRVSTKFGLDEHRFQFRLGDHGLKIISTFPRLAKKSELETMIADLTSKGLSLALEIYSQQIKPGRK